MSALLICGACTPWALDHVLRMVNRFHSSSSATDGQSRYGNRPRSRSGAQASYSLIITVADGPLRVRVGDGVPGIGSEGEARRQSSPQPSAVVCQPPPPREAKPCSSPGRCPRRSVHQQDVSLQLEHHGECIRGPLMSAAFAVTERLHRERHRTATSVSNNVHPGRVREVTSRPERAANARRLCRKHQALLLCHYKPRCERKRRAAETFQGTECVHSDDVVLSPDTEDALRVPFP
ncbi:hypothetical protein HPB50_003125 [Hyalomma asiaticum]|uniref:Uncharacterized protein n=1 Tax=Hyalomma asiaticum TaxID=266040 RepID=A0ACB7RRK1_HYAAI|nr:hypothetical protein HPB50_003125 [Hyalomma asiaticum]